MDKIHALHNSLSGLLNEVADHFRFDPKITLVVRNPAQPDGSQNTVITNDSHDAAIEAINISRTHESRKPTHA